MCVHGGQMAVNATSHRPRRLAPMNLTKDGRARLGRLQDWMESRTLVDAVERVLRFADDVREHVQSGGKVVFVRTDGTSAEVKIL